MNSKDSQSTGGYEFSFQYEGTLYEKAHDSGIFWMGDDCYVDEDYPLVLKILRGFVKSALQGKTIHVKVL